MILPLAEMMDEDAKPVRQTTTNSDREHTKSIHHQKKTVVVDYASEKLNNKEHRSKMIDKDDE